MNCGNCGDKLNCDEQSFNCPRCKCDICMNCRLIGFTYCLDCTEDLECTEVPEK